MMEKSRNLQIVIPMAGEGKRFHDAGYDVSKPLIPINGVPMIKAAIDSLDLPYAKYTFVMRENTKKEVYSILKENYNCDVVTIDRLTEGPAITCLSAIYHLEMENPLIIANCDQIMTWNSKSFLSSCDEDIDGLIVTYDSSVPHNSYALVNNLGYVEKVKEKEVISNISLNGIHYWRRSIDFVKSTCKMLSEGDKAPNGEFYVGPTYNHMINSGGRVKIHHLQKGQHWPVGTPADLQEFLTRHEKV